MTEQSHAELQEKPTTAIEVLAMDIAGLLSELFEVEKKEV